MRPRVVVILIAISAMFNGAPCAQIAKSSDGACFSIVVGKDASTTGFVTVAHNEDDGDPQIVNHHYVPRHTYASGATVQLDTNLTLEQVPETWAFIWSEIPGLLYSDSYLNEWGVCVCSDNCRSREDQPSLSGEGINWMLRRLIAERARTSREGVHLAGQLVERFGYSGSGRTYIISDPNEGWLFCAVQGRHWVAARVPDNQVALIANTYTVQAIDLTDTLNYLGSADIVTYATGRGWYNPETDGAFNFARAYAHPDASFHPSNIGRLWDGLRLLAADPPAYGTPLPFSVTPAGKLDVTSLTNVLRSHFEDTPLYAVDTATGCPHGNPIGPICGDDTQTSFVAELRGDMPKEIGLSYWVCLSSPCVSCYIPFHFGDRPFPDSYSGESIAPTEEDHTSRVDRPFATDSTSAYWTFTSLRHGIAQEYTSVSGGVRSVFGEVESEAAAKQTAIEQQALQSWTQGQEEALGSLRAFSFGTYQNALSKMAGLKLAR
jgi:dipeptidase